MFLPSLRICTRFLIAAGIFTVLTPVAYGAEIDFRRVGHGSQVSIAGVGTVMAGELEWQWVGTTPDGFAQSFYSYCVDVRNPLGDPQDVTVRSSDGFTNGATNGGAKAAWLFDMYAAGIRANTDTASANIQAAALQVAIWEAMFDDTNNLNQGNFQLTTTGQIRGQANTYLDSLRIEGSNLFHTSVATILDVAQGVRGQDQIVARISEPSTLLMMGVAFFMFARRARGRSGSSDTPRS